MTVRLVSLSIEPQPAGFHLPEHQFGQFLTHVHGENGAGKTAVMCALYWPLGGARQVEEPLWTRCTGVRLKLIDVQGRLVTLYRVFSERFDATVEVDGQVTRYEGKETEWTNAVLPLLGITPREWSAKNGGVSTSHLAVVLPAFAVDQDSGWRLPYVPYSTKQYIDDQAQEVVRLMLALPQLHDPKRDAQRKKLADELDRLDSQLATRNRALDAFAKSLPAKVDALESMKASRERLVDELKQFDSVVASMSEIDASLRARVEEAVKLRDDLAQELAATKHRRNVLQRLMDEGQADLELIGTNEVAADAFRRFCSNPSCQFFAGKAEPNSYGRRLLYLRDQFKDIVSAMDAAGGVLATGTTRLASAEAHVTRARAEFEAAARSKATDRVVAAIDGVTRQLASISRSIALTEEIAAERKARDELSEKRDSAFTDLANHDEAEARRRKNLANAASALSKTINRWLTVLNANEVGTIDVDDNIRVTVGDKVLTDTRGPSGSSRSRLILAYHAALLETSFELGGSHPPFLLFDAPKQHELNPADFTAYLAELRRVFAGKQVQVVISARSEVPIAEGDAVWKPMYPGEKHPWYLGPVPPTEPKAH